MEDRYICMVLPFTCIVSTYLQTIRNREEGDTYA